MSCSVCCKYSTNRTYLFVICDFNDIVSYAVLWPPLQEVTFLCAEIEWKLIKNLIGVQHVSKKTRNVTNQIDQGHGGQLYSKIQIVPAKCSDDRRGTERSWTVCVCACACKMYVCLGYVHACVWFRLGKLKKNCRREQSSGHIHSFLLMWPLNSAIKGEAQVRDTMAQHRNQS